MIAQSSSVFKSHSYDITETPATDSSNQDVLLHIIQQLTSQSQKRERELLAENERLKRELAAAQASNNRLEATADELSNEIQDLRTLLRRVYDEGELTLQRQQQRNRLLEMKNENLSNAHRSLIENLSSFQQLQQWSEFIGGDYEEKTNH